MALTLPEAAKLNSGDVIRAAVIELFARQSDLLRVMPFEDIEGNAFRYNQEGALPGIAFRGVNAGYTESVGVINPQVEPLVIAGGDLDVDKFIIDTNGEGVRATHMAMKVKALAQEIGFKMVKGDHETTNTEFDGLQARLTGDHVLARSGGAGAASVKELDEAIDKVDQPTHLLMNKAMRRNLKAFLRSSTAMNYTEDEFGRPVERYNDLPILIADQNGDKAALDFSEPSSTTSIYVLSLGDGMLQGLQNGVMDVRDLGELESKPVFRTRVEWYVSMALLHSRAASRYSLLTNVTFAA